MLLQALSWLYGELCKLYGDLCKLHGKLCKLYSGLCKPLQSAELAHKNRANNDLQQTWISTSAATLILELRVTISEHFGPMFGPKVPYPNPQRAQSPVPYFPSGSPEGPKSRTLIPFWPKVPYPSPTPPTRRVPKVPYPDPKSGQSNTDNGSKGLHRDHSEAIYFKTSAPSHCHFHCCCQK